MLRVTLKNLRARKLRLLLTGIAVTLGVAFMAGTLTLTDTVQRTFDDLFGNIYQHTDAVVRTMAFVVAPGVEPATLLAGLCARIEPAFLPRRIVQLHDVRHAFDQQADCAFAAADDDDGVASGRLGRGQAQPDRQIDNRQHRPAQIDHAPHIGRRAG